MKRENGSGVTSTPYPKKVPGQPLTFLCQSSRFLAKFISLVNCEVGNYVEMNVKIKK